MQSPPCFVEGVVVFGVGFLGSVFVGAGDALGGFMAEEVVYGDVADFAATAAASESGYDLVFGLDSDLLEYVPVAEVVVDVFGVVFTHVHGLFLASGGVLWALCRAAVP